MGKKKFKEAPDYSLDSYGFDKLSKFHSMILKGHVVLEHIISNYLKRISNDFTVDFFNEGFSFGQKTRMINLFDDIMPKEIRNSFCNFLYKFNNIRNNVAHHFEIDEKKELNNLIDEFVDFRLELNIFNMTYDEPGYKIPKIEIDKMRKSFYEDLKSDDVKEVLTEIFDSIIIILSLKKFP